METIHPRPEFHVRDDEYRRLLGYPRGHEPGERVRELMAGARDWYARHGRPWTYLRRVEMAAGEDALRLDGVELGSPRLRQHLREHAATEAVLLAVSAGPECEEHARELWHEGKPDEYFFLEIYGSAVVEDLVARATGRICAGADEGGLMAVPHYSPGYAGWDVAEQNRLFALIEQGRSGSFPGPLEVLPSGMLRPKKSLLAVFGLAPVSARAVAARAASPCSACSFTPCRYRRAPYRHEGRAPEPVPEASAPAARYSLNARALRKWAAERVTLAAGPAGTLDAVFRFDGTTCSHRPLAFDYRVRLGPPEGGRVILASSCAPAADDDGHRHTCSYLAEGEAHLREIAGERPLLGQPLDAVFAWARESAPAGCHCDAASRAHKWGLALEAIHFALAQREASLPVN